jgi:Tol biopolymer transport system component
MLRFRFFSRWTPNVLGILAVLVLTVNAAWATYPGQNGRIAFTANFSGTWQLYSINPDGSDLVQITNLPPTENPTWFQDYSPDGRRLVFCHDMTGALELYVINADGSGLDQLTHDDTENIYPHWSPDGTRVLFSTLFIDDRFFYHHLATIRSDGSDRKLLTDTLFDDYQAEYTRDGKEIVFGSTRRNLISALWTMNSNGCNLKQITAAPLEAGAPDLSPDGQHVVFWSQWNTQLPGGFWLADIDGKHLIQLRSPQQLAAVPVFSPDGKKIVFNGGPPGANPGDIAIMNADGSGVKVILSCPDGCPLPDWGGKP